MAAPLETDHLPFTEKEFSDVAFLMFMGISKEEATNLMITPSGLRFLHWARFLQQYPPTEERSDVSPDFADLTIPVEFTAKEHPVRELKKIEVALRERLPQSPIVEGETELVHWATHEKIETNIRAVSQMRGIVVSLTEKNTGNHIATARFEPGEIKLAYSNPLDHTISYVNFDRVQLTRAQTETSRAMGMFIRGCNAMLNPRRG